MSELLAYLPEQWVGIVALLLIGIVTVTKLIERYPGVARFLPGGSWWHERQKGRSPAAQIQIDNEAATALQVRIEQIAAICGEQKDAIEALNQSLAAFRAWSAYDARWHHLVDVTGATQAWVLPPHYDFFEFERMWLADPASVGRLPSAL